MHLKLWNFFVLLLLIITFTKTLISSFDEPIIMTKKNGVKQKMRKEQLKKMCDKEKYCRKAARAGNNFKINKKNLCFQTVLQKNKQQCECKYIIGVL